MEQTRLLAILDEVRPKRALLTTFTFSPGWFEGFCFPVLRLRGCESIDVLVDSRHACNSTAESSSQYAGNAYRVVSVFMKSGGFFHPKLAYLERSADDFAAKGDVLVVGSGNLTFAGQSTNLEVLDAVYSTEHPLVFLQFSHFCEQFAAREGLSSETRRVLLRYAARASEAAGSASPEALENPKAWLVHTLDSTAADQFTRRCVDTGPISQLTVLAPYHDPEGLSVTLLKQDTGARALRIGLSEPKRIAPFDANRVSLPEGTEFVVEQRREARFAHAKVFEAISPQACVVMTGSINATEQSLYSRNNVEVGLIRRLELTPFEWVVDEPGSFEPCEFEAADLIVRTPAIDAQLLPDGTMQGTVAPPPPSPDCRLQLWSGSKVERDEFVTVGKDGAFIVRNVHLKEDRVGSRLLVLTSGDFVARGWLNVESELQLTPREKDFSRAAARVSAGRASSSDLWAIYDVLKQALQRKPTVRSEARSRAEDGALPLDKATADTAYQSWSSSDFGDFGASSALEMQCLTAAFRHLNGDILFRKGAGQSKFKLLQTKDDEFDQSGDQDDTEPEDDRDTGAGNGEGGSDAAVDRENAEAAMLQSLPDGLAKDATHPLLAGAVQLSASEALKRAFRRRESFVKTGNAYFAGTDLAYGLDDWLARYSVFAYSDSNRRNLTAAFCALACCAAWLAPADVAVSVHGRVKEAVRALVGDLPDEMAWRDKVERVFATQPFVRIADMTAEDRNTIVATVPSILASTSPTEALEQLITNVFTGAELPSLPDAYALVVKALLRYQSRPPSKYDPRRFGVVASAAGAFRCPACNTAFDDSSALKALRSTRAAIHTKDNCNRSIFLGLDVKMLRAKLPVGVQFGV